MDVDSRPSNCIFCLLMVFFSLLLLQCDFNINLILYSGSSTLFTPYDAQASSACSALIICTRSNSCLLITQRQPTQQRTINTTELVREELATDQFDPWQVVPRQIFTLHSRLLTSTSFVVVSRVRCLGVTVVIMLGH